MIVAGILAWTPLSTSRGLSPGAVTGAAGRTGGSMAQTACTAHGAAVNYHPCKLPAATEMKDAAIIITK